MIKKSSLESGATADGYLTKKEIAAKCHRTPRTIEVWMRRGYLPFIKIGHSVLFCWEDVERHLAKHYRVLRHGSRAVVKSVQRPAVPLSQPGQR